MNADIGQGAHQIGGEHEAATQQGHQQHLLARGEMMDFLGQGQYALANLLFADENLDLIDIEGGHELS